jgi:hypothetical protein
MKLLLRYKDSFTSKPGMCKNFEYSFEVSQSEPIVGYSRSIPYGFINLLSAFIRTLQLTLGLDPCKYTFAYMNDDIL